MTPTLRVIALSVALVASVALSVSAALADQSPSLPTAAQGAMQDG